MKAEVKSRRASLWSAGVSMPCVLQKASTLNLRFSMQAKKGTTEDEMAGWHH